MNSFVFVGFGFINVAQNDLALRIVKLLNNNKQVFGANRRPIVQFSIENRRALQLQEERRERVRAKQEVLKNPKNPTLSFDNDTKKKRLQTTFVGDKNNKTRLSEIIKKEQKEAEEDGSNDDLENEYENNSMQINDHKTIHHNTSKKTKKRSKTKSKVEVRDRVDRLIAHSRKKTKPQLPSKTKTKWFE
jgi:hypothetical protein